MNIADHSTAFPLIARRPAARRKTTNGRTQLRTQWHRPWFERIKYFKEIVSGMSLMSSGSFVGKTETTSTRVPFSASLGVTPTIAHINTPRLLTITAYFPLGCGPTDATVSSVSLEGVRILEVRFDTPSPDFAFSDLVLVPYTVELTYTPSEAGDLPVRMMTSDGVAVGESVVMTRCSKSDDAQFDITGKWIDPATKETGLAFVPDSPRNNAVIGTWNFYDHQGVSHRYSIESVHWKKQDVEAEGAIFETTAITTTAPSPDLASAVPASANQVGLARITFNGLDSARIFALGFGGNVLFTSNLVRTTF